MIATESIDQLAQRLSGLLPPGVAQAREDIESNIRDVLSHGLRRLDLVTREEFDVQRMVLGRTRDRVEQLERRLAELEAAPAGGSADD